MPNPSRFRPDWPLAALACAFAAWAAWFASLHFHPAIRKIDDGAQYLLIAKSLARGLGFSNVAMPGVPDFLAVPSAFPLLLMPYWWLSPPPEFALHLGIALGMGLGAWAACLCLCRFLPRGEAFLIALAFAASPWFVLLSSTALTESPCVLFLYGGLWLTARDLEKGGKGMEGWLALLCWLVLFRLRINTMPFLVIHLAVLARRGEKVRWLAGAGAALAWLAVERALGHGSAGGYLQHDLGKRFDFGADPLSVAASLALSVGGTLYSLLGAAFGDLMLPFFYELRPMDPLKRLAVLAFSAWALWGLGLFWKRFPAWRPYLLAFLMSWAPFLLQRSVALPRYLYPSFPLLAACLVLPLHVLQDRLRARFRGRWAGIPLPALLLPVLVANQVLETHLNQDFAAIGTERAAYQHIHAFIRTSRTPPDIVLSHRHYHAYLETGRPSLAYPDQWAYARAHGMLTGRERVWIVLPVTPEATGSWDLGPGWRLGASPLAARGNLSLYELDSRP